MERKVLVVCAFVSFFGILSAALAFAAEATRVKECVYQRSPAAAFSLIAAVALVIANAIINTVDRCSCYKKQEHVPDTRGRLGIISFTVSWICFILGLFVLLVGSGLNAQRGVERVYFGDDCYLARPGLLSAGAILSLASVALGMFYYVKFSPSKNAPTHYPQPNQGIALGNPQIPPQTAPVFVHEDTYNRQQFP